MEKLIRIVMIFSIVFCFISCNQKPNYKFEEQKIRNLWERMCGNGLVNNWDSYSDCLYQGPEIQFLHPGIGQWLSGWDEVKKVYEPIIKGGIKVEFLKNDLKLYFSKDADLAWGTVDVIAKYNNDDRQIFHTWNIAVFKKEMGDWKLILANQSDVKD